MTTATTFRSYNEMQRDYHEELTRLAEDAFARYCTDPASPLYLFGKLCEFKRAKGYDELTVCAPAEACEGEDRIIADRIPAHLTRDAMKDWFQRKLRNTALWCFCY